MTDHHDPGQTIDACINRLNEGDPTAASELLNITCERLTRLTRSMLKNFPNVARWEQTDDVFQNASLRFFQALRETQLTDARHYFRLAALQIRRELVDMARRYQGPQGMGANHQTQFVDQQDNERPQGYEHAEVTNDPGHLAEWQEFHSRVDQLPTEEKEVFDLLWYHDLSQEQAAHVLDTSVRTIRRRWRSARLMLHDVLLGTAVDNHEEDV
ncbi:sigma-70 family RNA polymerase sigma factor [Bremerella cremea]|uniref:Sigma-70 family RNA polymerase sigma factor n=1 Tax=Blastopirellula marina TaxID=124 RepID=A0A2S8FVU8_9BACT|nr:MULTISPECIES: sigma-70 family RNA polymerase sigma factor [Pirellulaceae]PQO36305.1 sigma-70 family RNA polymerase sigma factor [Blastopirellula marina]RCS48982.1 sigma-70 family RNA polymerase sigma factor [Bremerella cremea]